MRLSSLAGSLVLAILISLFLQASLAAQQSAEERLGAALIAEESKADPAKALAVFDAVLADKAASEPTRFRAGLGKVRCLIRLQRKEDVDEAMAKLEALVGQNAARRTQFNDLQVRRQELDGSDVEITEQEFKTLQHDLGMNNFSKIDSLGTRAAPAIVKVFLTPRDSNTQSGAIKYFARRNDQAAMNALATIWDRLRPSFRKNTSRQISHRQMFNNSGNRDRLIRTILADMEPQVRVNAPHLIRFLRDPKIADFEVFLKSDVFPVRKAAFRALAGDGSRILSATDKEKIALRALGDPHEDLRAWILGRPELLSQAISAQLGILMGATKDPSPKVREAAYRYAGSNLSQQDAREVLLQGLADHDDSVRISVLHLLSARTGEQDIAVLRPLLVDPSTRVCSVVVQMLRKSAAKELLDTPERELFFRQLVDSNNEEVRYLAASVLARAGSDQLDEIMATLFDEGSQEMKAAAFFYTLRHDKIDFLPRILGDLPFFGNSVLSYTPAKYQRPPALQGEGFARIFDWLRMGNRVDGLMSMLRNFGEVTDSSSHIGQSVAEAIKILVPADRKQEAFRLMSATKWPVSSTLLEVLAEYWGSESYALDYYFSRFALPKEHNRNQISALIGTYAEPEYLVQLISLLATANNYELRVLLPAIVRHADSESIESLDAAFDSRPTTGHELNLIKTLGAIPMAEAVNRLLARLEADHFKTSEKRAAAMLALTKSATQMGEDRSLFIKKARSVLLATMKLHRDTVLGHSSEMISYRLHSSTGDARIPSATTAGVVAIFRMDPVGYAAYAIEEINQDEWSPKIKRDFLHFLVFSHGSGVDLTELLRPLLQHPEFLIRRKAIEVAAHILTSGLMEPIKDLLKDPKVHSTANNALRRFANFGYRIF
ncbi:MAG: HEAT repeat domain-containing protein [Planctomycetota bacterium]